MKPPIIHPPDSLRKNNASMRGRANAAAQVYTLGLLTALACTSQVARADQLHLHYESAPAATGPWTQPKPGDAVVFPDGSIEVPNGGSNQLFRLSIQNVKTNTTWGSLTTVPPRIVELARDHFLQFATAKPGEGSAPGDDGNWSGSEEFSPRVLKIYDASYRGGLVPAYYEFKIIAVSNGGNAPAPFLDGNTSSPEMDRGYLLMSAHEGDSPVVEFASKGRTPGEELLGSLRSQEDVRLLRFGPAFLTAEDAAGNLLAKIGTQPFRVPADILRFGHQTFSGKFNSDTDADPERGSAGPRFTPEHYDSYADFKADYLKNPVYQEMRERRALGVRTEWDVINGRRVTPPIDLIVGVRQATNILSDRQVSRFLLDDDDVENPLAAIATNGAGGLTIVGMRPGGAFLTVQSTLGLQRYWLTVPASTAPGLAAAVAQNLSFVAGWQAPSDWWAYGGQPRYYQPLRPEWCKAVGCGPLAWAMLLAWWDNSGVPSAFAAKVPNRATSAKYTDAQMVMVEGGAAWTQLKSVLDDLHEECDVICSPVSDAGATWPGDMMDGLLGKTYYERNIFKSLGLSYAYSWDLIDPDWNQPSTVARQSLYNHRPAALGLGYLWHYVLAYAYRYQVYKTSENASPLYYRRWFLCNMGWNKANGTWYSGNDTFFGAHVHLWQKASPLLP